MNKRNIIIVITLFVLLVAGMFGYAYWKNASLNEQPMVQEPTTNEPGPYDYIEHVDAKHFFIDGTHTVVGEIPMPTPCDLLDWDTRVAESFPEQVTIAFDVINNADVCAQVITPARFSVSFDASENASIQATLEGRPVRLNLIPAAEGETPDDFELYIKG